MVSEEDTAKKQAVIRLFSFLLAIVPTSITVSFAAFVGSESLLFLALIPCVITLAISIIPTSLPLRLILACGVISFLNSVSIIVYTLAVHMDKLKYYMPLPFD